MKFKNTISGSVGAATFFLAGFCASLPVQAADLTAEFDQRHVECLQRIAEDADLAYEEAMIWRDDGGGRRAKHCEAMALFAVGQKEEAAHRLSLLAKAADGGSPAMRANYYAESADFWLIANKPKEAYAAASAGLKVSENHLDLRIARARAYALLGRYDWAETDLTSVLAFDAKHSAALRYRADARLHQEDLSGAKADIESALTLEPTSVETALLRGQINEALRQAAAD